MDFVNASVFSSTDLYECIYCNQTYPSKRDLTIHKHIHGDRAKEDIFKLTTRPRNNYLVYEEFILVCGDLKSAVLFKEIGCAETPEQDQKSPSKEFDNSLSSDLSSPPHETSTYSPHKQEIDFRTYEEQTTDESNKVILDYRSYKEISDQGSETKTSVPNSEEYFLANLPHVEKLTHNCNSTTSLSAYKTFDSMTVFEDPEGFESLAANIRRKYETFPRRSRIKHRDKHVERYKTDRDQTDQASNPLGLGMCGLEVYSPEKNVQPAFTVSSERIDLIFVKEKIQLLNSSQV